MGTGPARALRSGRARLGAALLAIAALALAAGYGAWHSTFGQQLEYSSIDARFNLRGTERPSRSVVVVGIDAPTIEALHVWPLQRRYDAQMIDRLLADGAKVIAYDLVFDTKGPSATDTLALFDAAARARGRLVLGGSATNAAGQTNVLGGPSRQRAAGFRVGSIYFVPDSDGVIRRVPASIQRLRSFAGAVAIAAGEAPSRVARQFADGFAWIDFPGAAGTVPQYSFVKVLDRGVPASRLRGRIVVVGATEAALQDVHAVAVGGAPMSGPELEADAISTLLDGTSPHVASGPLSWLILIAAALCLPLLAAVRRPWPWIAAVGVVSAAAYVVVAQLSFDGGTILLLIPTLVTLLVAGVGAVLVPLALERRELRLLRDRFARFDPVVVNAVLADPGVALRLRALALGPESVIAGYRLVRLAGRGGMGVVYEALQLSLARPVALKLIDPAHADDRELRARFIRESRIAASLAHPHVIPVYEAGEDGGLLFIAMRLVTGGSMHELIATRAPLAPALAASLVSQVASALDAAHASGLVHRDVKPANILLEHRSEGEAQHCYLTDFGVTREASSAGLTVVGERIGTVDYMAPEQCRGGHVGPSADLYSLACVLFEALTGSVPYPRGNEAERVEAHLSEPPPVASERWPGVPAQFDPVLQRAMAKDPAARFHSGLELERAVLAAAGIEPVGIVAPRAVAVARAVAGRTRSAGTSEPPAAPG